MSNRCNVCQGLGGIHDANCVNNPDYEEPGARLDDMEERLRKLEKSPRIITGDMNTDDAAGALLVIMGTCAGILIQTIGEEQLRREFENLIATAYKTPGIKVKL